LERAKDELLAILVLLFRAPLFDCLTERARMVAIERLGIGFVNRGTLRVGDDHARPRHGLQQGPMQSQGQDQEASRGDLGETTHDGKQMAHRRVSSRAMVRRFEAR
jgi:hypothetical protein